uniref:Guanine nucleotide exchange factor DBS-like isoform X2 n=1 Tax=Petromyzon marinus TaxID=7757 RepID=A0AAJ7XHM4_PETMA|nr:guanine nucleotide exchange factor DBS-like isoform X2 [Petromyzon marinus]
MHKQTGALSAARHEIMEAECRELRARDLKALLEQGPAVLTGGRGKDGSPIITLPECPSFCELPDADFQTILQYLTSIPKLDTEDSGFILVIDRRQDRWSSLKVVLMRISELFPAGLREVHVLRPCGFLQSTFSSFGLRFSKDEFNLPVQLMLPNSLGELHMSIDRSQLTPELGGTLVYTHSEWIQLRSDLEGFSEVAHDAVHTLQAVGLELAETELPNTVRATEELLGAHSRQRDDVKALLESVLEQGRRLLSKIAEPTSSDPGYQPSLDRLQGMRSVQRLLSRLGEADGAADKFWAKHHLKLQQCLQFRYFEQDFREVMGQFEELQERNSRVAATAENSAQAKALLQELQCLDKAAQVTVSRAERVALTGERLISEAHYAVDSIQPKCSELRKLRVDFSEDLATKLSSLAKAHCMWTKLEKALQWYEDGMYLLACQPVAKFQSQEGAEVSLREIEAFMENCEEHQVHYSKSFHEEFESILAPDMELCVQRVFAKLEKMGAMMEERRMSLCKLTARHARPVQPVAPQPETVPEPPAQPATNGSPVPGLGGEPSTPRRRHVKQKSAPKIEVVYENSQGGVCLPSVPMENEENLTLHRSHIMTELLETERVYVEELQTILEGYADAMETEEMAAPVPAGAREKKDVLFGNMADIYHFHSSVFLKELEDYTERPEEVGSCYLKRKEDFRIYEKYCQNKPQSETLWRQISDAPFFQECQKKLGHKLALDSYLLKPVQRITRYQLLLKELLKGTKDVQHALELEEALASMQSLLKSLNDSMHQISITGYKGNLLELGKLLMQGSFSVWTDHKKGANKVKDFPRFKPMQRHVFLYEKTLLFCKRREETTEGYEKTPSYGYKHSLQMSSVGITENVRGDSRKFEIWCSRREQVYIIQAPSNEEKSAWVSEIRKLLTMQLQACKEEVKQVYCTPSSPMLNRGTRKSEFSKFELGSPKAAFRMQSITCSPNMPLNNRGFAKRRMSAQETVNRSEDEWPLGYRRSRLSSQELIDRSEHPWLQACSPGHRRSQDPCERSADGGWSSGEEMFNASDGETEDVVDEQANPICKVSDIC